MPDMTLPATLSSKQIGMVAWNAGIHDQPTLARAIAVAMAESGGNPKAHNTNAGTGDNSYGLWQINMLGSMGPARRKQFGIATNEQLFDPATNAKAMMILSNGTKNWAPWSAFKNGSYLRFMPAANSDAAALVKEASANSPNPLAFLFNLGAIGEAGKQALASVNPLTGIQGSIANAMNGFIQTIFKVGFGFATVVVAISLIIVALVILMRAPLKKVAAKGANVVTAVVPGGKIATQVTKLGAQHVANKAIKETAGAKLTAAGAKATRAQTAATKAAKAAAKVAE